MSLEPPSFSEEYLNANKGPNILATIISITAVSTLFVCARLFVRGHVMKALQADDYLIIVATICAWTCVGLSCEAVRWGNGRHFPTLDLEQMQNAIKYTIFGFPPGIMSFSLPKFAVVHLLTRLLNPGKWHRVFLWGLAAVTQLALLGCIIILFAQCTPSASQWDFSVTQEYCWDRWFLVKYSIGAGALSAFADLYLAVYPMIVLVGLQIELKKKIALCIALGIGSVATVVAIYKTTSLPSLASPDFSWDTSDLVIWTIIEGSTIIIASCIPLLQPIVDIVTGRRSVRGTSGYKNYGSSGDRKMNSNGHELESNSRARRFKGPRDPNATLLATVSDPNEAVVAKNYSHTTHASSQESILEHKDKSEHLPIQGPTSGQPRAVSGIAVPSEVHAHGNHGIVRTHEVTVAYGATAADDPLRHGQPSWRAC